MKGLARLVVIVCFLIGSASVAGAASDPSFHDWLSLRDDQGTSFQLVADALDGVTGMSWAPSGHLIAYVTAEGNDGLLSRKDVVVAAPSGEQHVVWARAGESPTARWSPDSRHLAIFPRRHTLSIWRSDGTTRDITSRLIENATFGGESYWTANSRYIVGAASSETTAISSAIVVDVDSGKVTRRTLPRSRGGFNLRGVLGDRLLITCGIPRCSGRALYTLPPVGAPQLRQVASIRGNSWINAASVSPDRQKLALDVVERGGQVDALYWSQVGATPQRLATVPGGVDASLLWAPNSSRLLVGYQYNTFDHAVAVISWGGSNLRFRRYEGRGVYSWAVDSGSYFLSRHFGSVPGVIFRVDAATGSERLISDLSRLAGWDAQDDWVGASPTTERLLIHSIRRPILIPGSH